MEPFVCAFIDDRCRNGNDTQLVRVRVHLRRAGAPIAREPWTGARGRLRGLLAQGTRHALTARPSTEAVISQNDPAKLTQSESDMQLGTQMVLPVDRWMHAFSRPA
jgi:hypothetical protein